MTVYAKVQGSTLILFPYTHGTLLEENPSTNYGPDPDVVALYPFTLDAEQHGYTLAPVSYQDEPTIDPATQSVSRNSQPTLVDGVWILGWTIATKSSADQQAYLVGQQAMKLNAMKVLRDQKLAAGFDYTFPDARGTHHIATSDVDMKGWSEVTTIANAAIALAQGTAQIAIITDTGPVTVTALEWQSVLIAAGTFRQPIWAQSFVFEAQIAAATDQAALAAVNISAGWPD